MPIFEFHCNDCGKDFEKLVFGGDPQVECPDCKKPNCEQTHECLQRQGGSKTHGVLGLRRRWFLHRLLGH